MTKTQEELTQLKVEYETLNSKLKELNKDELNIVVGGYNYEESNLRKPLPSCPLPDLERLEQDYNKCIYKDTAAECIICKNHFRYRGVTILPLPHHDW